MNKNVDAAEILFAQAVIVALQYERRDLADLVARCRLLCRQKPVEDALSARALHLQSDLEYDNVPLNEEVVRLLQQVQNGDEELQIELSLAAQRLARRLLYSDPERSAELTAIALESLPTTHREKESYQVVQEFRRQRVTRAVETISQAFGDDSLELADALVADCDQDIWVNFNRSQGPRMLECYSRALKICTGVDTPAARMLAAVAHARLGKVNAALGNMNVAIQHHETALDLNEKHFGLSSLPAFHSRHALTQLYSPDNERHRLLVAHLFDNSPVAEEVAVVAKWWADHFRVRGILNRIAAWFPWTEAHKRNHRALRFQMVLEAQLLRTLDNFPTPLTFDYGPDSQLEQALADAGIANLNPIPLKSVSCLDMGKVTVRSGTWRKERVIYKKGQ